MSELKKLRVYWTADGWFVVLMLHAPPGWAPILDSTKESFPFSIDNFKMEHKDQLEVILRQSWPDIEIEFRS